MLADNRIALNAGWDVEMLNLELKELSVLGADLEALGFTAEELAAALTPVERGSDRRGRSSGGRRDRGDASRATSGASGRTAWSAATAPTP